MDRDFDTEMDVLDRDFDRPLVPPIARRNPGSNPGSVAEMLDVLADRLAMERPLTDAELAAKYPESVIDDDAEWDDREDPSYFAWLDAD